jgi:putative flippase GtrA
MEKEIKKFISYFIVGGLSAIVEWVCFAIFNKFMIYLLATILAFCFSTTFNYFLGKKMTFKNYEKNKTDLIGVFIVSGIGLVLNILIMFIIVGVFKFKYEFIAKIIATGLVFIWNYVSRRIFIYKKELGS